MYVETLYHKILNRVAKEPAAERVIKSTAGPRAWYVKDLEIPNRRIPPKALKSKKEAIAYAEENADAVLSRLKWMIEIRQGLSLEIAAAVNNVDKIFYEIDRIRISPSNGKETEDAAIDRAQQFYTELGKAVLPNLIASEQLTAGRMYYEKLKGIIRESQWQTYVESLRREGKLKGPKSKPKPLPPNAEHPTDVTFNSHAVTCYGKPTKRGYRVYCRRKV